MNVNWRKPVICSKCGATVDHVVDELRAPLYYNTVCEQCEERKENKYSEDDWREDR